TESGIGDESRVPIQYKKFHREVEIGHQVYLDDGNLSLQVVEISGPRVVMEVKVGGRLSDFKGVNMPDATLGTGPLTPKDKEDLKFGLQEGV
ncbi:MAG: pyruvate kinase, partial [Nitrospinaceae bacterium]|nr:pyruvate kinase [Nitrospinaceae bacterium]NIT84138.1 pyruvate kinase [Nitrospinaceae bacterium]NIU98507.1 pyruvate kinase [Nitrospinaceae bacterium]NIY17560.1 pyruvate kinase [Nitrospinaceae bacterium]